MPPADAAPGFGRMAAHRLRRASRRQARVERASMGTVWDDAAGPWRTPHRGRLVLAGPRINKGAAFGETERRGLEVTGLIPPGHTALDEQVARVHAQY